MTREDIIERCAVKKNGEGAIFFIENFCKFINAEGGRSRIKLFRFQKEYIKALINNKVVIVLKPRQVGISTITAAFLLWEALITEDGKFIVISINELEAESFLYKIKVAYEELPKQIFGKLKRESLTSLKFETDSSIEVRASGPNAGRGLTPTRVMMDEAAFMTKRVNVSSLEDDVASKIWTSVGQSLKMGGQASITSTPNGCGGFYHAMWSMAVEGTKFAGKYWDKEGDSEAELGSNGITPFLVDWWDFDLNTQEWYDNEIITHKGRERVFNQEILHEFLGSGDNVVSTEVIRSMEENLVKPPIHISEDKQLYIWRYPQEGHKYIVGVDPASAKGDDFLTIQVVDRQTLEQAAEYKGHPTTIQATEQIYDLGRRYNNAEVIIETNYGLGISILEALIQMSYGNIYRYNPLLGKNKKKAIAKEGIHITPTIKQLVVNIFKEYIEAGNVGVRSARLCNELKTYVWKNNQATAEVGFHDDLTTAMQLVIYCKHYYKEPFDTLWFMEHSGELIGNADDFTTYLDKIKDNNRKPDAARKERMERMLRLGADPSAMLGVTKQYLDSYNLLFNDKVK